jgi:hypothetical protein
VGALLTVLRLLLRNLPRGVLLPLLLAAAWSELAWLHTHLAEWFAKQLPDAVLQACWDALCSWNTAEGCCMPRW